MDYFSRFTLFERMAEFAVGGFAAWITGLITFLVAGSLYLAIPVGIAAGVYLVRFVNRSEDAWRKRKAEAAKTSIEKLLREDREIQDARLRECGIDPDKLPWRRS